MPYTLGARSLSFCSHVDPRLMAVANLAISISGQDFGFTQEQSRTLADEQALVARGVSHTLKSHHIIGTVGAAPGYSGALDAVPWNGSAFVWEWPRIYVVAKAFQQASIQLKTPLTWGGVWDRFMSEYNDMQAASADYIARKRAAGNPNPFVDGPHFELGAN